MRSMSPSRSSETVARPVIPTATAISRVVMATSCDRSEADFQRRITGSETYRLSAVRSRYPTPRLVWMSATASGFRSILRRR